MTHLGNRRSPDVHAEHSGPGFKILGDFCYTVVEPGLQDVLLVSGGPCGTRSQLSPVFPTSLDKVADMVRSHLGSFSPVKHPW